MSARLVVIGDTADGLRSFEVARQELTRRSQKLVEIGGGPGIRPFAAPANSRTNPANLRAPTLPGKGGPPGSTLWHTARGFSGPSAPTGIA